MTTENNIHRALASWSAALGSRFVTGGGPDLAPLEATTLDHRARVAASLRPGSAEEVQAAVRIAAEYRVPLYPISRGKNWGYGSRVPYRDGVVLDLGRLNRIRAYDPELATVTVEPGVTQEDLVNFLADRGGHHWADTTSVTPKSSVLGNALARGHGLTPYADHAETLLSIRSVLGDGRLLSTGYGEFEDATVRNLDPWGVGPSLTGLFTQSNYGVVTEGTIALLPAPECARAVVLDVENDEELFGLIPVLNKLRIQGTIESGPRFANVYRSLMFEPYPWDRVEPGVALAKDVALELAARNGRGAWSVSFGVYGPPREVEARLATIKEALAPVLVRSPRVFDPHAADLEGRARVLGSLLGGRLLPGGAASVRTYWKKRDCVPGDDPDPDRDRCGVIWLAPVSPFRARDVARVQELVEEVLPKHGFEPDISCYGLRARLLHFHISIIFDRDVPGADAAAKAAHDELLERLLDSGYPPHRLGVQSMSAMGQTSETGKTVLRNLKRAFDPAGVIAPGSYCPPNDRKA